MVKKTLGAFLLLISVLTTQSLLNTASADERSDLQQQIDAKTRELDRINREMSSTKSNLEEVQKQKQALQKEISTLQTSMKHLDLSIKADELSIQKLNLEINNLNYDIKDIQGSLEGKRFGIEEVFRELQKEDNDSLLIFLLKNESVETALSEIRSLALLKQQLIKDIEHMQGLKKKYATTLDKVSDKKSEIEVHKTDLANKKLIIEDQKNERQTVLSVTKSQESVYASKLTELQRQQQALEDEVDKIEDRLKQGFNSNVLPSQNQSFGWPVGPGVGRITQNFGEVSYLYRGKPHNGLDIGLPVGTPIIAVADGIVMASGNNDVSATRKYQYGKYVLLKHGNNLATLYAHLSRYTVSSGQSVKKGDVIGYSGNTGYSTGPHLHLGLYWAPTIELKSIPPASGLVPVGVVLNPRLYINP